MTLLVNKKTILSKVELISKLTNKEKIYVDTIKYTLKYYKQSPLGKKKELIDRLKNYYDRYEYFNIHLTKIVFLQKKIRNYLKHKKDTYYTEFNNTEDFFTLEPLCDIPKDFFFYYKDSNKFKYGFDIRSFQKLVNKSKINPYNREDIPNDAIEKMNKHLKLLQKNNISIEEPKEILSEEQIFKNKVITVFQKIDNLNITAGGTSIHWFLNLSLLQLKQYYRLLEDIWNYRAELSVEQKKQIVPNERMFKHTIIYIFSLTIESKRKLQHILLKEMDTLVSASPEEVHRHTGGYYILIGLTEVSYECGLAMPWLLQY